MLQVTDNGVNVTNSLVEAQYPDVTQTEGLIASAWDSDYSYSSMSNASNAYSSYASSNYATITLNTGSNAETYAYLTFDTSNIPDNAIINSVSCMTRCAISSTSGLNTYTT